LDELNHLRSPLVWNELLGNRIGYVNGDKACAYSSNPNRLHTAYYIGEQTMEGSFDDWDGTEQTAIASDYIMTSVSIYHICLCLSIHLHCNEYLMLTLSHMLCLPGETLCQVQNHHMLSYCSFRICILSYWNYEAHQFYVQEWCGVEKILSS